MADPNQQNRAPMDAGIPATSDDSLPRLETHFRTFTPWQRILLFLADWMGYFAVLLIGRSLR